LQLIRHRFNFSRLVIDPCRDNTTPSLTFRVNPILLDAQVSFYLPRLLPQARISRRSSALDEEEREGGLLSACRSDDCAMIAPFLASVALSGALPTRATCHVMMTLSVHMSCLLNK